MHYNLLFVNIEGLISPLIQLVAGLGAFLVGVKIMSDSMSRLADNGLKTMFQKLDNKSIVGVGIGAGATAIIQSSAVTTVMVVGFVNAGMMSLTQATAVIMGANIGTTITAQLAALQSFDFMQYVIALTLVGILIMSIAKKERVKTVGLMIAGLGLIFLALQFMSSAMIPFKDADPSTNPNWELAHSVQTFLTGLTNPFLLLVVGIAMTFLLQSSSALTTIVISMAASGLIIGGSQGNTTNGVLYIILGSNIGTCFTTMMATANTTVNAKRAGLIHLIFNLFGSLIFFVILLIWTDFTQDTLAKWFDDAGTQIAMFHTLFNTICTIIFVPIIPLFVKVATILVPSKGEVTDTIYIDNRFLATPAIAIAQSNKEAKRIGELVMQASGLALEGFLNSDGDKEAQVIAKLNEVSILNQKLIAYMVNISAHSATLRDECNLSQLHSALGDLLRIGDLSHNITKYTQKVVKGDVVFTAKVYSEVSQMYDKIKVLYDKCINCYITRNFSLLPEIAVLEDDIDETKRQLISGHITRLNNGECNPSSSSVFVNLVGNIERMADHMTYIAGRINETSAEIV